MRHRVSLVKNPNEILDRLRIVIAEKQGGKAYRFDDQVFAIID